MENKCSKGFFLGGLLIATAAVIFAMSKDGKELTKKLKEDFKTMTTHMKENLGKFHSATKEDFEELVNTLVEEYAKKKELSEDSKKKIVNLLKSKWNEIKAEYVDEAK